MTCPILNFLFFLLDLDYFFLLQFFLLNSINHLCFVLTYLLNFTIHYFLINLYSKFIHSILIFNPLLKFLVQLLSNSHHFSPRFTKLQIIIIIIYDHYHFHFHLHHPHLHFHFISLIHFIYSKNYFNILYTKYI